MFLIFKYLKIILPPSHFTLPYITLPYILVTSNAKYGNNNTSSSLLNVDQFKGILIWGCGSKNDN